MAANACVILLPCCIRFAFLGRCRRRETLKEKLKPYLQTGEWGA